MILKNNLRNILKSMSNAFYFLIIFPAYIILNNSITEKDIYLKYFFIIYFIFLTPAIYLLIEYLIFNNRILIHLTKDNIEIISKGNKETFHFNEIDYIIYTRPQNVGEKIYIPYTIHEKFHFIKIVFKNKKDIFITSIMIFDTDEVLKYFKENKIIRVRALFSSLFRKFSIYIHYFRKSS